MSSRIAITLCLILLAGGLCSGCSKSGSKESKANGTVTEAPTESLTSETVPESGDREVATEPEENKDTSQSADSEAVSGQDSGKKPGKENVKYTLSLDDVPIPKDGKVEIDKTECTFKVREEIIDEDAVGPDDFLDGNIEDHVLNLDYNRYEQRRYDGTTAVAATYTFKKIPKGKKITIEISKELADRAGLTTNIIVITVV